MNAKKERILETFVIVMFPIALFVGCTSNGNGKAALNQNNQHSYSHQQTILDANDLTTLTFSDDVNKKVDLNAPRLQHAVYKPTGLEQDNELMYVDVNQIDRNLPEKHIFKYESDQYNVNQFDLDFLKQHALFLTTASGLTLTVSGHSDNLGPADYNKSLSHRRAQLVYEILVTYGAPAHQIIVDSYGEAIPRDSANDRQDNRRVELEYSEQLMLSARQ